MQSKNHTVKSKKMGTKLIAGHASIEYMSTNSKKTDNMSTEMLKKI